MKKAFDQTVRDLKRGVNKKVLKVPSIEQKVLDATSNEPWGPHGSHLADIAMATRNYNEYQMIMAVIWKRISDTGKNWRHVYKALTVLEYLVAHGSERVIDEIKEHAYQISTLSDFQYIDSSGRDQGSNVRKKSQSLVVLVNDKERIQEVRQKAAANRDKYRNTATGGIYRPGSYGDRYDEDRYEGRYGSRDDDHNGYGREREYGYRDDDRYGRYGDSYGRDGERYGRDYDDRYSRHGYRDDDYRGRSQSIDDSQYGSRSRSSDRDRDRAYDDDGQYSSRGSNARADDHLQDGSFAGRKLERKFSEQNLGAPPSYEETVGEGRSPAHSERDGETATAPKSSPPPGASPKLGAAAAGSAVATAPAAAPPPASPPPPASARPPSPPEPPSTTDKEADSFDEFDPRASFSAAPAASNIAEVDLLGSLSDSFAPNPLAIMPVSSASASEAETSTNSVSGPTFVAAAPASTVPHQAFDDPFGDGTFKATLSTEPAEGHGIVSSLPFHSRMNQSFEPQAVAQNADTVSNSEGNFPVASYAQSSASNPSMSPQYSHQDLSTANQETDILADILPPTGLLPPAASQPAFPASTGQPPQTGFAPQTGQPASLMGFPQQVSQPAPQTGFPVQNSQPVPQTDFPPQASQHPSVTGFLNQGSQSMAHTGFPRQSGQPPSLTAFPTQVNQPMSQMGFPNQTGYPASRPGFPAQNILASQMGFPAPSGQATQMTPNFYGGFPPQPGPMGAAGSQMAPQFSSAPAAQHVTGNFIQEPGSAGPAAPQMVSQMPTVSAPQHNSDAFGNLPPQVQQNVPITSQPAVSSSAGPLALVSQPSRDKEKFEPKSAVWADTLSRGLVNLNISGSKTNPLADIGVDFDSINRKEKRMEKPSAAPVTSTVTMGKAMGAGTGIGRAGAGALRGPPNSMVNSGMGAGMGMGGYGGANQPMGMGGYGGVNQPMGMGLGMGMNMAMGQGGQMRPPAGFPPGSNMPGAYNPMMGSHGYGQPPYGGGYQ